MPYTITWWKSNEVLYIKMHGKMTIEELEQITQKSLEHLRDNPASTVHAVTDALDVESVPHNIPALIKNMNANRQPNSGYTIIVSGNKTIQFIANTLMQVLRMDMRLVSTLDEARQTLEKFGISSLNI